MEATSHVLAKPYVLLALALGAPPVLAWDTACSGLHTCFSSLHVTEDLDGISSAAKVRIHPVVTCWTTLEKIINLLVQQTWRKLENFLLNIVLGYGVLVYSKQMLHIIPILSLLYI